VKRTHIIAAAGGMVVLLIVWYAFLFSPQSHKLSDLQAKQTALETTQSQLTSKLASLKKAQTHQMQRQQVLDSYNAQIPSTADMASFINDVNTLAADTNVTLSSLTPTPPAASQGVSVSTITVTIKISAPYSNTVAFLQGLYSLPRLVIVDGVSIGGASAGTGGTTAGTGSTSSASASATPTPNDVLSTTFKTRIFTTAPPTTPSK
jgi:Tfp pilus assembly protein PilO